MMAGSPTFCYLRWKNSLFPLSFNLRICKMGMIRRDRQVFRGGGGNALRMTSGTIGSSINIRPSRGLGLRARDAGPRGGGGGARACAPLAAVFRISLLTSASR